MDERSQVLRTSWLIRSRVLTEKAVQDAVKESGGPAGKWQIKLSH